MTAAVKRDEKARASEPASCRPSTRAAAPLPAGPGAALPPGAAALAELLPALPSTPGAAYEAVDCLYSVVKSEPSVGELRSSRTQRRRERAGPERTEREERTRKEPS